MKDRINGGEYTVLIGEEGAERKLFAYKTVGAARAAVKVGFDGGLFARAVIVKPSGLVDVPDFREVHEASG